MHCSQENVYNYHFFFLIKSVAILHNSVNTTELCTQKWLDGKLFVLFDSAVPCGMWDLCFLTRD